MGVALLETLANFAVNLKYEDLPQDTVSKANDCFFDLIGCYYGAVKKDENLEIVKSITSWNASQEASAWGFPYKTGHAEAALVMGYLGYNLEYDDGISVAGHWGSASIPATYLGVIKAGGSGKQFIAALIAAYEVGTRISRIFAPRLLKKHVHFPCTMGAFAAATGYGKAIGFNSSQLSGALSLAGLFPVGAYSTAVAGAKGKSLYSGWPNYLGINACRLADVGLIGDPDILEHDYGFGNALGLGPVTFEQAEAASRDLGDHYLFMQVYFKRYPCCRWLHAPVSAVESLMQTHGFKCGDIEKITIGGPEFLLMYNTHTGLTSKVACQYSMPYSVAAAMFFGKLGVDEYEQEARDVLCNEDFIDRIEVETNSLLDAKFPGSFEVEVNVHLKNGLCFKRIEGMPWGPESPPSKDELIDKFTALTKDILSVQTQQDWVNLYRAGIETPGVFEKVQELLGLDVSVKL